MLQLSMLDFPLILQVKYSVVHRIQPQCSMIATGVETKATGDSKLNGSPANKFLTCAEPKSPHQTSSGKSICLSLYISTVSFVSYGVSVMAKLTHSA